jgi:hypothetical protein
MCWILFYLTIRMELFENQTSFSIPLNKKDRKNFSNYFHEERQNRFLLKRAFTHPMIISEIQRGTRCVMLDADNYEMAFEHKISGWSTIFHQIYNFFIGKSEITGETMESIYLSMKLISKVIFPSTIKFIDEIVENLMTQNVSG